MGAYGSPDLSANQNQPIQRRDFRQCPKCGFLYSKALSRCPRCASAPKKPVYKRWWYWLIMAVATLFLMRMCVGCASVVSNVMQSVISETEGTLETEPTTPKNNTPTPKIYVSEDRYKQQCTAYSYEELARNPNNYRGAKATFTGEVIQVQESGQEVVLRVNVTKNEYGYYEDTIYVDYSRKNENESRVLEGDTITLYGEMNGLMTYEAVLGNTISIPHMLAKYIDIHPNSET